MSASVFNERMQHPLIKIIPFLIAFLLVGCGGSNSNNDSVIKITDLTIETNGLNAVAFRGSFTNKGRGDLHNLSYWITSDLSEFGGFGKSGINLMIGESYDDVAYNASSSMYYQPGTYNGTLTVKNDIGRILARKTKSFTILDPKTLPIAVKITDLHVETDGHSFITFKGAFLNSGDIDLYALEWELSSNYPEPISPSGTIGINLPIGQTEDIGSTLYSSLESGTYEVTLYIKLGNKEKTILAEQTESFTIN